MRGAAIRPKIRERDSRSRLTPFCATLTPARGTRAPSPTRGEGEKTRRSTPSPLVGEGDVSVVGNSWGVRVAGEVFEDRDR